jgi:hypothetical protein
LNYRLLSEKSPYFTEIIKVERTNGSLLTMVPFFGCLRFSHPFEKSLLFVRRPGTGRWRILCHSTRISHMQAFDTPRIRSFLFVLNTEHLSTRLRKACGVASGHRKPSLQAALPIREICAIRGSIRRAAEPRLRSRSPFRWRGTDHDHEILSIIFPEHRTLTPDT